MNSALNKLFLEATTQKKEQKGLYIKILDLISEVDKKDYSYIMGAAMAAKQVGNDSFAINLLSVIYNDESLKSAMYNPFIGQNILNPETKKIVTTVGQVNQLLEIQRLVYDDRPIPSGMKKVLKEVLENSSSQELLSNLDKSRSVSLRDSIKLLHPKPKNALFADLFVDIIRNRAKTGRINESIVSLSRKYEEGFLDYNKVIQFIEKLTVSQVINLTVEFVNKGLLNNIHIVNAIEEILLDPHKIEKENVQPFEVFMGLEFLDLAPESTELNAIKWAMKEAFHNAVDNVKFPLGRNLILVDTSYAMEDTIPAGFNGMNAAQVAAMLGAIALVKGKGKVLFFDDKIQEVKETTNDILEIYNNILELEKQDGVSNFKNALGEILVDYNSYGNTYDNVIVLTNSDNYIVNEEGFIISNNNSKHWRNRSGGVKDFRSPEQVSNGLCEDGIVGQLFLIDLSGDREYLSMIPNEQNEKVLLTSWCDNLDKLVAGFNLMDDGFDSRKLIEAYI